MGKPGPFNGFLLDDDEDEYSSPVTSDTYDLIGEDVDPNDPDAMASISDALNPGLPFKPYGSRDEYQQDLTSNIIPGLMGKRDSAVKDIYKRDSLSPEQGVTSALMAVLPMILGGAMYGMQGAGVGAEAGMGGAATMLKGIAADNERERKAAALDLKGRETQLSAASKDAATNRNANFAAEEREQYGKNRDAASMARTNVMASRAYGGGDSRVPSMEEKMTVLEPLIKDPAEREKVANSLTTAGALERYSLNFGEGRRSGGVRERLLDGKTIQQLRDTETAVKELRGIHDSINKEPIDAEKLKGGMDAYYKEFIARKKGGIIEGVLGSKDDSVVEDGAAQRVIKMLNPNSTEALIFGRLREIGRQIALAEPGVMTEEDARFYYQMFTPRMGESTDTFLHRLQTQVASVENKLKGRAEALGGKGGRFDLRGVLSDDFLSEIGGTDDGGEVAQPLSEGVPKAEPGAPYYIPLGASPADQNKIAEGIMKTEGWTLAEFNAAKASGRVRGQK